MTTNSIPQSLDRVITLAQVAYTGAFDLGVAIGLAHNTATAILTNLRAVIGTPPLPPDNLAIPGTVAIYDEGVNALIVANGAHRDALAAARIYCREAIDYLRRFLGRRWNSAWGAAGFTNASLAVPTNPEVMLARIRSYLVAHPAHANPGLGVSVAGVQLQLDAIDNTRRTARTKLAERVQAKENRDDSIVVLRQGLTGLRNELDQLLDADDERWYQFGFDRPSDGRTPSPVRTLSLRQGLPGEVIASWTRAEVATSYRLSWRLNAPEATPVLIGLFTDRIATITGLPSGQSVIVSVSGRNATGESAVTESTIVVP